MLRSVYVIGFVFGLVLCFDSVFMPEFKEHFRLDYTSQMYILFAKNIPFILFSIPIGYLIKRTGYKNCLALSLALFAIGTYLLVPALRERDFGLLMLSFFINGVAFNCEIVSWSPMLVGLGEPAGSSARMNLGNALGAIAQIVAPLVIVLIIPSSVVRMGDKLPILENLFEVLSILLLAFSVALFIKKGVEIRFETAQARQSEESLWKNRKVLTGLLSLFLALGVEAGIFGLYRNFLEDPAVGNMTAHQSQVMFMLYFALFAAGRVAAWQFQNRVGTVRYTMINVMVAVILLSMAVVLHGPGAIWALSAAGFFISTLFPSLYAISIAGLGNRTSIASGLLAMGMLGAAVIPVLQGRLADLYGIQRSFLIVFIPYLYTLYFLWTQRAKKTA
jgi:FHS family L-fucose permease-like MFS transporter